MQDTYKYANNNIKLLLKFKNWTQDELCKRTGISKITLQRRLRGTGSEWDLSEAISIAKAFKTPVKDIFFTRLIPNGIENNEEKEEKT
ncbi:MAG: helix-turn-helix transcriptional regulator [Endomicrobiaceae bacterium]|nr:helix-turn-helix transcriptional regulator [Endomicrobiaceae bacterium]